MKTAARLQLLRSALWTVIACLAVMAVASCAAQNVPPTFSVDSPHQSPVPSSVIAAVFAEEVLADNVFVVRRRANGLSGNALFEHLLNWVLPSESHATIRLSGAFTPTDPAPIIGREFVGEDDSGGTLVSPAFDLLDVAKELGQLELLRTRVELLPMPEQESQQRARLALLVLLSLELNDVPSVEAYMKSFEPLVKAALPNSLRDQWPETLVAYRSVTERKILTPDGWGAQWSPDGKWVAYESRGRVNGTLSSNITIIDAETLEQRTVLEGDQASRYSQIFWNMEWSPDSRKICFKGKVKGEDTEIAITAVAGSSHELSIITNKTAQEDFSWHPDGSIILFAMHSAEHNGQRIFSCNPLTKEITLLMTQPLDQKCFSPSWSADGRRIAFVGIPTPKTVLWRPN